MKKTSWPRIARLARLLIVVVIFIVIYQSMDWHRFILIISEVNPWLIMAGILYYPFVIMLGASRWHTALRAYHADRVHYGTSLKDYWSGLAVGVFAPASIGWDVYRVAVATRRYGGVVANSATIVVEKIAALLTSASLVALLVPFMEISADNKELQQIIKTTYIILICTLGFLVVTTLVTRHGATVRFFQVLSEKIIQWLYRLSQRSGPAPRKDGSLFETFSPLCRPGVLLRVTALSFFIPLAAAVGNHIFFIAVNYELPFLINLFVVPILNFIFLLPISFGSLGIREGAYILIYGAFGVPIETALLVSFLNLAGILLNNLVGGMMLVLGSDRTDQKRLTE